MEHTGGVETYYYEKGQQKSFVTPQEIVIEDYSSFFQLLSSRKIPMELDLWGGFFAGSDCNFVVVGRENRGKSDSAEVIRVIKCDKSWNRLGAASLKGASTTDPDNTGKPDTSSINFSDVKPSDYFAAPVAWAIGKGVTNGTSATEFSPYETCSVAQILTFLWRAEGQPRPSGTGRFSNVSSSSYYADAASWAKENGLVAGNTFAANAPCTRAMVVTYLYRALG